MRVLHLVNVRWFNATAWYALNLARLQQRAGHEVLVATLPDTPPAAKADDWGLPRVDMDLNSPNPLRFLPGVLRALRLLATLRPQVVVCHRGEGFVFWCLLRRLGLGFRLVRTRGDQRPPRTDPVNRLLHARLADAVVATNRRMAAYFTGPMHTPPGKVWCIPGGVDTRRFAFDPAGRERVRAEFGFGPEHFVIGLLGRFDRVKGQREAIAALAELHRRGHAHVRLLLIGFDSADSTAKVHGFIREHGMEHACAITGRREDVAACLSATDLGLVASLWSETIARAALEFMACARPLVSTDVGVMPDLVDAEGLAPPGDARALATLLERAAADEAFRTRLAERQGTTLSQYTDAAFLKQSQALFTRLVDGGK